MNALEVKSMAPQILLIEDCAGDVLLTKQAFHNIDSSIHLHAVCDGVEAMTFLRQEGAHAHAPRPDLILLDLNLPKMDGREVLAYIKENDSLKTIPTVILTSSEMEEDVAKGYRLRANCYLRKPIQWDAFESLLRSISDFWLTGFKSPAEGPRV